METSQQSETTQQQPLSLATRQQGRHSEEAEQQQGQSKPREVQLCVYSDFTLLDITNNTFPALSN